MFFNVCVRVSLGFSMVLVVFKCFCAGFVVFREVFFVVFNEYVRVSSGFSMVLVVL